ncbi:hypothetical protein cypCar_00002695, partial [Cyprinus carpio]
GNQRPALKRSTGNENGDGMDNDIGKGGGDTEEEEEEEEASKPNDTPSEDEMKDADEGIQNGGEEPKAVRKRRVRKD